MARCMWRSRAAGIARFSSSAACTKPSEETSSSSRTCTKLSVGDLVGDLAALVRRRGLPASRFCIEVTEGAFSADPAVRALERARQLGFSVAMDDFGVGYSALSQLPRLPLASLKLDRSFIVNATRSAGDAAIFFAITQLAHALKLVVVAEGVEDQAQLDLVANCGCDAVQGYFLARPMRPETFRDWLLREYSELRQQRRSSGTEPQGVQASTPREVRR